MQHSVTSSPVWGEVTEQSRTALDAGTEGAHLEANLVAVGAPSASGISPTRREKTTWRKGRGKGGRGVSVWASPSGKRADTKRAFLFVLKNAITFIGP